MNWHELLMTLWGYGLIVLAVVFMLAALVFVSALIIGGGR